MRALVFVAVLASVATADTALPPQASFGGRVLDFCCTHDALEKASADLPRGRWTIDIVHKVTDTTCTYSTVVRLGEHGADLPFDLVKPILSRCPLELAEPQRVEVTLRSHGSLECCGKITVERVAFSPAPAGWSAERCRWMYAGLAAAWKLGTKEAYKYVRELPP
jgi:hypothetical protein